MQRLPPPMMLHQLTSHSADVQAVLFSPSLLVSAASDKTVRLYDLKTYLELPQSPLTAHKYKVHSAAFSPLFTRLATSSMDGRVHIWDVQTWSIQATLEHESRCGIRVCRFSPCGSLLATGGDDNKVCLFDLASAELISVFTGHDEAIVALDFSPNSSHILSGSTTGDLRVWAASYPRRRWLYLDLECHAAGVSDIRFAPQQATQDEAGWVHSSFATVGHDHSVALWQLQASPDCEVRVISAGRLTGHASVVTCCSYNPSGSLLATCAMDKTVRVWNVAERRCVCFFEADDRYMTCCAFSTSGDIIATGSKQIRVWRLGVEPSCPPPLTASAPEAAGIDASPALDWGVSQVCEWLVRVGLQRYEASFRSAAVNGQALLLMTSSALREELGVESLSDRLKIRQMISLLPGRGASTDGDREESDEFRCPITRDVMNDPVVASDGYTYERGALLNWLKQGNARSPMTNATLDPKIVVPNHVLRLLIKK